IILISYFYSNVFIFICYHRYLIFFFFFFFNATATTEIYTLSLHDALPIYINMKNGFVTVVTSRCQKQISMQHRIIRSKKYFMDRSEEHTSELQSRGHLVCRLLLEKKKKKKKKNKKKNKYTNQNIK